MQVGGSLQSTTGYQTSAGVRTPFDQVKMSALQNLMDDMEVSSYYGLGEDPAVATRPKQKGLKALLSVNNTTNPTNAGAYKATDFIRDTLELCRLGGGDELTRRRDHRRPHRHADRAAASFSNGHRSTHLGMVQTRIRCTSAAHSRPSGANRRSEMPSPSSAASGTPP